MSKKVFLSRYEPYRRKKIEKSTDEVVAGVAGGNGKCFFNLENFYVHVSSSRLNCVMDAAFCKHYALPFFLRKFIVKYDLFGMLGIIKE